MLDRVKRGDTIVVLEYGRPIAQISKPVLTGNEDSGLAGLEREGLVSIPVVSFKFDSKKFIAERPKLKKRHSLLKALLKDREESL